MRNVRTGIVLIAVGLLSAAQLTPHVSASSWPERPVRLIIASPPGSGDDFVARVVAPMLSDLLGQQVVVDNRADIAGGVRGQMLARKALPDGYTFLLAGGSMAGARYANAHATYDVLRDFTPVSLVEVSSFVLAVYPGVPAKSLKDFIALARSRAKTNELRYGTTGQGQLPYWSAVLFNHMAEIHAVEVPYKGSGAISVAVMSGEVEYFFSPSALVVGHTDRLRLLGVTTSTRSPALPEVPTIAEAGLPEYEMPAWRSIMGPAGIRPDIVSSLNSAIRRTLATPDIRDRLRSAGSEPTPSTPEELASRYADWIERFGQIAKRAGLKPL